MSKNKENHRLAAVNKLEELYRPEHLSYKDPIFLSGVHMLIFDFAFNAGYEARDKTSKAEKGKRK